MTDLEFIINDPETGKPRECVVLNKTLFYESTAYDFKGTRVHLWANYKIKDMDLRVWVYDDCKFTIALSFDFSGTGKVSEVIPHVWGDKVSWLVTRKHITLTAAESEMKSLIRIEFEPVLEALK